MARFERQHKREEENKKTKQDRNSIEKNIFVLILKVRANKVGSVAPRRPTRTARRPNSC